MYNYFIDDEEEQEKYGPCFIENNLKHLRNL